jgi:hypothetical protein
VTVQPMLFTFLPSLPLGVFKVTTVLVVVTALAHQLYFAVTYNPSLAVKPLYTHLQLLPEREKYDSLPATRNTVHSSFGACLMVKDDNDLLSEWLAYHYTILPLRYLVVGMDVNSTQNPSLVLQRWNTTTDLNYWVLDVSEFTSSGSNISNINNTNRRLYKASDEKNRHHHSLIRRQKQFVKTCSQLLQSRGVQWTAYIDSDEFVVPNILTHHEKRLMDDGDPSSTIRDPASFLQHAIRSRVLPIASSSDGGGTTAISCVVVLDVVLELQRTAQVDACYTMPRLLVGALQNRTCHDTRKGDTSAQSNNNTSHRTDRSYYDSTLSTLRFVQHATKGDFRQSKFGKVFLDLSRIPNKTIAHDEPRNIHRPYREYCGPAVVHFPNAAFYVAHYIGSWERYSARGDRRRNRAEWEQRAFVDDGLVCETGMPHWISRFVAAVGGDERRANFLLGTGNDDEQKHN